MAVVCNWNCFIFFAIFIQVDLGEGIELSGPNVCWKDVDGIQVSFCCSFFVQQDGQCRECEDGTFSNDSISCTPCPKNMFGRKCKFRCSCLAHERCDPRSGCIDTSDVINADVSVTIQDVKMDSETRSTVIEPSIPSDLKITYIYYILAAGGVIGWIIFCLSCSKLIYKRRFQVRPIIQNGTPPLFRKETLRSQCRSSLPAIPRKSHHIYDTVDELLLSNIPSKSLPNANKWSSLPNQCTPNIDVTNNVLCSKLGEQEYLNPYTTLKDNSKRVTALHEYVDCSKSCEQSKDIGMRQTDSETRCTEDQATLLFGAENEPGGFNRNIASEEKRVLNDYVDCSKSCKLIETGGQNVDGKEQIKREEIPLCMKTDEQDYLIMR